MKTILTYWIFIAAVLLTGCGGLRGKATDSLKADSVRKVLHQSEYSFFVRGDTTYRVYPYHWQWLDGRVSKTYRDTVVRPAGEWK